MACPREGRRRIRCWDAHVYWDGRLIGLLRNIVIDQPYYHSDWFPSGDAESVQAYRALQTELAPDGLAVLPVTVRSADGTGSAAAAAVVRPGPEPAPDVRFGHEGLAAGVGRPKGRP
jgi:hypothetical protein